MIIILPLTPHKHGRNFFGMEIPSLNKPCTFEGVWAVLPSQIGKEMNKLKSRLSKHQDVQLLFVSGQG